VTGHQGRARHCTPAPHAQPRTRPPRRRTLSPVTAQWSHAHRTELTAQWSHARATHVRQVRALAAVDALEALTELAHTCTELATSCHVLPPWGNKARGIRGVAVQRLKNMHRPPQSQKYPGAGSNCTRNGSRDTPSISRASPRKICFCPTDRKGAHGGP
jgi:hypothetical protein